MVSRRGGHNGVTLRMPGNRSGLSLKVTGDIVHRLSNVRALWLAVQNDPDLSVQDAAVEFYYTIGQLLEGNTLEQIELRKINRARVLAHAQES
jgi:hypothetical protein